jgi:Lon protease-like protein
VNDLIWCLRTNKRNKKGMNGPFDTLFEDLPETLPIFPLTGAILLPGARLPLNIFEPRYLRMTFAALRESRLIGMIQPKQNGDDGRGDIFSVGCAGRISSFAETEDGRLAIALDGACRFRVMEELETQAGFRRVIPGWDDFKDDLAVPSDAGDRTALMEALTAYARRTGLELDWERVRQSETADIVRVFSMIGPFSPMEKQAIVEATSLMDRTDTLVTMLTMAVHGADGGGGLPS